MGYLITVKSPAVPRSLALLTTICLLFSQCLVHAAPDIQLTTGIARGYDKEAAVTLKPYLAFYGIPFAEPPVGELRFLPPRPYVGNGQDQIITSDTFRASCYQLPTPPDEEMSEDCLHLNIFSPSNAGPDRLKKVMFWIHGGGFTTDSAAFYSPSRLVTDKDVIVVTTSYRLAAFGFLSSGDDALKGNMGLQDQLLALKWVKDNIRQFGGDSDDITIFGQSSGGACVSALILTPGAKGLFTKVFLQSGTALAPWAMIRNPREVFYNFARKLRCLPWVYSPWSRVSYHRGVVRCLKTKPASELVAAHPDLSFLNLDGGKGIWEQIKFGIVVDYDFVPRSPEVLLKDKAYLERNGVLDRSYLLGSNNNEGILSFWMKGGTGYLNQPSNVSSLIKSIVHGFFRGYPTIGNDAVNLVDFLYTFPRDADGNIPVQKVFDIQSDNLYFLPTYEFARALAEASDSTPVYMYQFNAEPVLKDPNGPIQGTNHAMDLYHVFDDLGTKIEQFIYFYADKDPVKYPIISNAFRSYLTDFAKTGNPTGNESGAWPRFEREKERYLAISSEPEVRELLNAQRVSLWLDFLPKMKGSSFYSRGRSGRPAYTP